MQVKAFDYLIEVSKCGSFYGAAKNLGISQQGLTKVIDSLEAELNTRLVVRGPRGVRLTREGEIALSHAQQISGQFGLLLNDLTAQKASTPEPLDRIRVHVSYYSAMIASADARYVGMLAKNLIYTEEPFDKLVRLAEVSDGSSLVFADVYTHTLGELKDNKSLRFVPLVSTKMGFVWKDGSALANEQSIHRETVSKLPVALNSSREPALLLDKLFAKKPFADVRLETSSPRMLLNYALMADDVACTFDSLGFYLANKYSTLDLSPLHFTPLSTPKAQILIGFMLPVNARLSPGAKEVVDILRRYLAVNCGDYLAAHPLPA